MYYLISYSLSVSLMLFVAPNWRYWSPLLCCWTIWYINVSIYVTMDIWILEPLSLYSIIRFELNPIKNIKTPIEFDNFEENSFIFRDLSFFMMLTRKDKENESLALTQEQAIQPSQCSMVWNHFWRFLGQFMEVSFATSEGKQLSYYVTRNQALQAWF